MGDLVSWGEDTYKMIKLDPAGQGGSLRGPNTWNCSLVSNSK